jgi:hypothetical protein
MIPRVPDPTLPNPGLQAPLRGLPDGRRPEWPVLEAPHGSDSGERPLLGVQFRVPNFRSGPHRDVRPRSTQKSFPDPELRVANGSFRGVPYATYLSIIF